MTNIRPSTPRCLSGTQGASLGQQDDDQWMRVGEENVSLIIFDFHSKDHYLLEISFRRAQEADRVLFRGGDGHRSQQDVRVGGGWNTVNGHDAGDFQSDVAKVVDVAGRL